MVTRPKKQHTYPVSENKGYSDPEYRSRPEYHTARWQRMRKVFLNQPDHLYCARCRAQGRYTLAKVVDHIIPAEICGNFWDTSNWQPLCRRCNDVKAAEDREKVQAYRRRQGGANLYGEKAQDRSPRSEDARASFETSREG